MVKNTPTKAGDTRSTVSTLQLGRSPRVENGKPLSILGFFGKIPRTEEPGRLQAMRLQRVRHDLMTEQAAHGE